MSSTAREKFSSQASPDVLTALRQIAEVQGRQFQAVLDEALRDYIDRQQKTRPRRHVMASFASSLDEFDHLYRELAKKAVPHDYLTVADVLGMHTILMQRYGGAGGVRDPGALEAALFRPQTGYYSDIIAEAAALLESLAINHPFVDGNKRIAFAAADVFLRINGWYLKRQPMIVHTEMLQMLETGTFDIAHLEPWLRGFAIAQE